EVPPPFFFPFITFLPAFLPIYTLQAVEGKLFKPMAWTVCFALLGALVFSIVLAPVLASLFFSRGAREWHNPFMVLDTGGYRPALPWAVEHRWVTLGVGGLAFA